MNFLYFEENRKDRQSLIVKMGYMLQKEERRMGGGNVSQDQTSIICIDLKSFYASVECVERGLDPFKANLVVADPTRSKSTICLAITPAMKALGIKNRCRIHEIPDCVKYITAMPRMQLYMDYSAKIYGIYLRYVSKEDIHVYSVDECFIDVTNYLQLYHLTAKEMAVKLMQAVMGNGSGADDKCQRGSREAISKRRGTEPKTGAAVRIKCTSQYG